MTEHADRHGRTAAERVADVMRHGDPITEDQRAEATALLVDMLDAAERHGFRLDHFDWVSDLPGACVDVVTAEAARRRRAAR